MLGPGSEKRGVKIGSQANSRIRAKPSSRARIASQNAARRPRPLLSWPVSSFWDSMTL